MNEEETQEPVKIYEVDGITIKIPDCCREGYADCKHVVNRERPGRKNIAV